MRAEEEEEEMTYYGVIHQFLLSWVIFGERRGRRNTISDGRKDAELHIYLLQSKYQRSWRGKNVVEEEGELFFRSILLRIGDRMLDLKSSEYVGQTCNMFGVNAHNCNQLIIIVRSQAH